MKNNLYLFITSLIFLAAAPLLLVNLELLSFAHAFTSTSVAGFKHWFTTVHKIYNDVTLWHFDRLLLRADLILNPTSPVSNSIYLYLVNFIFFSGFFFWAKFYTSKLNALFISLTFFASIFILFNYDLILITSLAWLPWLVCAIERVRVDRTSWLQWSSIVLFCSYRLSQNSNYLGFLIAIWILCFVLRNKETYYSNGFGFWLLCILLITPNLRNIIIEHNPSNYDYPAFARVVPDDGLAGIIHPLFGESSNIPYTNRLALQKFSAKNLLPGILLLLYVLTCTLKEKSPANKTSFYLGLAGIAALCWDSFLPPYLANISPLAALQRVIPGLYFYSPQNLIFALSIVGLIYCPLQETKEKRKITGTLVFLAGSILIGLFCASPFINNIQQTSLLETQLLTPSYGIYTKYRSAIEKLNRASTSESLAKYSSEISISTYPPTKQKRIAKMFDGKTNNRWSSGRSLQLGDEQIYIHFAKPVSLRGIDLLQGKFKTDFPRGLRVSYLKNSSSAECQARTDTPQNEYILYSTNNWQGSILWTKSGLPYYSSQSTVKVIFTEEISAQCLVISQTGKDKNFDWSVAEILLLKEPTPLLSHTPVLTP